MYEKVRPYGVYVRRTLPFDEQFHREDALRQLDKITTLSSALFVRFDKHIDKVSREARGLFGSAANKPEHLQTVLSELNSIGSEVDNAAKTLQEKIAAVTNKCHSHDLSMSSSSSLPGMTNADTEGMSEALCQFPWHSRRYLFLLTSAWNERLSAAGQALAAMKKLAASSQSNTGNERNSGMTPNVVPAIVGEYGNTDDVMEGMKRLRQLQKVYSQYNVDDMTMRTVDLAFENTPATTTTNNPTNEAQMAVVTDDHDQHHQLPVSTLTKIPKPQKMHKRQVSDYEYHDYEDVIHDDVDCYDDFADMDDGAAVIDADVLASRRRLYQHSNSSTDANCARANQHHAAGGAVATTSPQNQGINNTTRVKKSLGSARRYHGESSLDAQQQQQQDSRNHSNMRSGNPNTTSSSSTQSKQNNNSGGYGYENIISRENLHQLGEQINKNPTSECGWSRQIGTHTFFQSREQGIRSLHCRFGGACRWQTTIRTRDWEYCGTRG